MSAVVETSRLTKRYRDLVAVNDLNLKVEEGEIFGFLGPNGAGKTTTILMLLGLTEPASGQAKVCGFDPTHQPLEVKKRVGYLPENPGFYDDLSGQENLFYIARLNRIPTDEARRRITRLLEQIGLGDDGERAVREYSRGMKQRLGIAEVLIKEPQALILDEPTLGLDPDGASRILDLITGLSRERGLTVLLSSHMLHQVQQMCHRVGIIVKGKMIAQGQVDQLGSAVFKERQWNFLVEVEGRVDGLESELRALHGVAGLEARNRGWFLRCTRDVRPEVLSLVSRRGLSLLQLRSEDTTLEDIYLKYFREA
ncbi:MAG: ABC transporter ATP-binding protein [Deltaproteobacteria bacterium]|nr:ABC transporter ATP-binding protein [Deltaproteobacteria bacterium]MBI2209226.1 ABC transporter ATP-binding protein [Deltaproteobacteria bacterium]MBI2348460.1 ABC transporter ATP-binding protein [Deltaproteobacteria bacterium]MBI2992014.1 ABC transporter ATP-binding protein [Deltaproteobacteria bacterium]MBI3060884.1 ABC transporter ATP-binding protein [Deltaproteobacteria bacterium]